MNKYKFCFIVLVAYVMAKDANLDFLDLWKKPTI